MFESYLLMIIVTVEQEEAIQELFSLRGWKYKRKEYSPDEIQSGQEQYRVNEKGMIIPVKNASNIPEHSVNHGYSEKVPDLDSKVLMEGNDKSKISAEGQVKCEGVVSTEESNVLRFSHSDGMTDTSIGKVPVKYYVPNETTDSVKCLARKTVLRRTSDRIGTATKENIENKEIINPSFVNKPTRRKRNEKGLPKSKRYQINEDSSKANPESNEMPEDVIKNDKKDSITCYTKRDLLKLKAEETVTPVNNRPRFQQGKVNMAIVKDDNYPMNKDQQMILKSESIDKHETKCNKKGKVNGQRLNGAKSDFKLLENLPEDLKAKVVNIFKTVDSDKKGDKNYNCFFCSRTFLNKSNFIKHIDRHNKQAFDCPECGKRFKNHRNMYAHRFNRSKQKTFTCDICKFETTTACLLRIHSRKEHPPSEFFHCHMCPRIIRTKSYLNVHLQKSHGIHEGDFECHICGKKCKRPKLFQKHLKEHENDNTVNGRQCQICEKTFKSKLHLRSHMRIHEKRKHMCNVCGKSFTTITKLVGHERTHTGEKPYQCEICDYKSTQAGNLRSHMKVHQRDGESKPDMTKTARTRSKSKSTVKKLTTHTEQDTVYQSTNQADWYNDKYNEQNILYTEQGEPVYSGEMNYDTPKDIPVKPNNNQHTAMSGNMYTLDVEPEKNQYTMTYNEMDTYTNSYVTSQYYNTMDPSFMVQNNSSVTSTGKQQTIMDPNNTKQYAVPNSQSHNIHQDFIQQPDETINQQQQTQHQYQQQNHHHLHHYQQQQQHCQTTVDGVMYQPSPTSSQINTPAHMKRQHVTYGVQHYTDSRTVEHPNSSTYSMDTSTFNDEGTKAYVTNVPKSDFTNTNMQVYLGTETGQESMKYSYTATQSLPYTEGSSQSVFDVHSQHDVLSQQQSVHTQQQSVHSQQQSVHLQQSALSQQQQQSVHLQQQSVHSQQQPVLSQQQQPGLSQQQSVHSQQQSVHSQQQAIHTQQQSVHTQQSFTELQQTHFTTNVHQTELS